MQNVNRAIVVELVLSDRRPALCHRLVFGHALCMAARSIARCIRSCLLGEKAGEASVVK